jgi:hypothetical protein
MSTIDESETSAEEYYAEGLRLIKECRYRQAVRVFDQALVIKAGYAEAFFGRLISRFYNYSKFPRPRVINSLPPEYLTMFVEFTN